MATKRKHSATKGTAKKSSRAKVKAVEVTVEKQPEQATPTSQATAPDDSGEICVFAIRLKRTERDLIHKAAGSGKASQFVRALALAGARGDMKAVTEIIDGAHAKQ